MFEGRIPEKGECVVGGVKKGKRPCIVTEERVLEDGAIDAEQGATVITGKDCNFIS
jgi:hypothetical protein